MTNSAMAEHLIEGLSIYVSSHLRDRITEGAPFFGRDDGDTARMITSFMRSLANEDYAWPDGQATLILEYKVNRKEIMPGKIQVQLHHAKEPLLDYEGISVITSGGIRGSGDNQPEYYPPKRK